jgi:hypothetical protein
MPKNVGYTPRPNRKLFINEPVYLPFTNNTAMKNTLQYLRKTLTWRPFNWLSIFALTWAIAWCHFYIIESSYPGEALRIFPHTLQPKDVALYVADIRIDLFPIPSTVVVLNQSICTNPDLLQKMAEHAAQSRAIIRFSIKDMACQPTNSK